MKKIITSCLIFSLLVLSTPSKNAYASMDELERIAEDFKNNYPSFVENKYNLILNQYYFSKSFDVLSISKRLDEDSLETISKINEILGQWETLSLSLDDDSQSLSVSIIHLKGLRDWLYFHRKKLIKARKLLKENLNVVKSTCSDKNINRVSELWDPIKIFDLPQISFDGSQVGSYSQDISVGAEINLNTDGDVTGGNLTVEDGDESSDEFAVAGLVIGTIISCLPSGCTTGALGASIGSAVGAAIGKTIGGVYSMKKENKAYKAYKEKLNTILSSIDHYAKISSDSVSVKKVQMVKDNCASYFNLDLGEVENIYESRINSITFNINNALKSTTPKMKEVESRYQVLKDKYGEYLKFHIGRIDALLEKQTTHLMLQTDKHNNHLQILENNSYTFFTDIFFPAVDQHKKAKSFNKINSSDNLWNSIILGDNQFNIYPERPIHGWQSQKDIMIKILKGVKSE
jgi:hypothetical protein